MSTAPITPTDFAPLPEGIAESAAVVVEIAAADAAARSGMNTSGITPTEYNVLVKMDPVAKKSAGGVFLPDDHADRASQRAVECTLTAASPMCFEHWPEAVERPSPGQRVIITRHAGLEVTGRDGETYRIISDKDVRAVLEAQA